MERELPALLEGSNMRACIYRPGYFFPSDTKEYRQERMQQRGYGLRLADHDLAEAVRLGSLVPSETVWSGARITDRQGAQEALGLARRLRDDLVREAVAATADLAQGTGTVRARTVAEVSERHRLFAGLQTTLDRLVPEVFDVPVLDLVAATGDDAFGIEVSRHVRIGTFHGLGHAFMTSATLRAAVAAELR